MDHLSAITAHWLSWIARVEALLGRPVPDMAHARAAFECDFYPKRSLTADEYAAEVLS